MTMTKRIPVSESVWKQIGKLKDAGETYDGLLKKMLKAYNRMKLMQKMENVERKNKEDLVALDDL
ncbi:MAG: hypothetical protein KAW47_05195 [Thermoplasmatales archaeon]|nr:hypothetical protein [Thermoplasmatales archaeon]